MTKEQIRPTILKIIGQIVPDEDLKNLKGDIPIRGQMGPESMDFLGIIVDPRKCCGVRVCESDYVRLPTRVVLQLIWSHGRKNSKQKC